MKPTIRNKLIAGFSGVLVLMGLVAAIGAYSVFSLRRSAYDATRIGARLNAAALEIQVHNLEAERRIKKYLAAGEGKSGKGYREEADFESHEIETLTDKAIAISPTPAIRAKFETIRSALAEYRQALGKTEAPGLDAAAKKDADNAYEEAAETLHESAEDGELVGRDASQSSLEAIDRTSERSVALVTGFSLLGLALGIAVSYKLARAILVPVEHLKSVAENVSLGNLNIAVNRYSNDEIGDLADSFSRMVAAVKFFRLESEMAESEKSERGEV